MGKVPAVGGDVVLSSRQDTAVKTARDPLGNVGVADAAIARVLAAEIDARLAVEQAQVQVQQIAEAARAAARAVAERTERHIRAVTSAFERDLAARLAAIDAEARRLAAPQALGEAEAADLARHVRALAQELVAGPS